MFAEISTLKLEFNPHTLPLVEPGLTFSLAVRESCLHYLNGVTKLSGNHSKKEDDAILVYRLMA